MKSTILLLTAIPLIFLAACSDPENAPTAPQARVSVHLPGWNAPASTEFHGEAVKAKNFDASECRQCHGVQYDGGIVGISCKESNCHTKPGGPEACNTCHGNFGGDPANLTNVAPPRGLNDETATTTPAVGAHQAHLAYPSAALAGKCQQCHALPQNFAAPGHIDSDGKVELLFNGDIVNLATEGGTRVPNVSYREADNTCAGTYCHGNWGLLKAGSQYTFIYTADKMEGGNASPKWTESASGACGTCHGLPPTGHLPFPPVDCTQCHTDVVDANLKIIDNTKHVNGKVNVFMQEYPMF